MKQNATCILSGHTSQANKRSSHTGSNIIINWAKIFNYIGNIKKANEHRNGLILSKSTKVLKYLVKELSEKYKLFFL